MGIDYKGIGGIGIKFTDEMQDAIIEHEIYSEEELDDDKYDCLDSLACDIGCTVERAGSCYSGDIIYYLMVCGNTLVDINNNASAFIDKLEGYGIVLKDTDLTVISDKLVY